MPLDMLGAGVDGVSPRRVDTKGLKFDLMMRVLQRDDPLRQLYIQRRWHGYPPSVPCSLEVAGYTFERPSLSPIPRSHR
jgi:hypothetical protein